MTPGSGIVGQPVTITGTSFGPAQGSSLVRFNTLPAAVTQWSATSITAVVPPGATSGRVSSKSPPPTLSPR